MGSSRTMTPASIRREQIDSLHELGFVDRRENVVFLGPTGVGKTHLAIRSAIAAAQHGRPVYYRTIADLITSLEEAQAAGRLQQRLKVLTHPSVLVVDGRRPHRPPASPLPYREDPRQRYRVRNHSHLWQQPDREGAGAPRRRRRRPSDPRKWESIDSSVQQSVRLSPAWMCQVFVRCCHARTVCQRTCTANDENLRALPIQSVTAPALVENCG
jgi:hypothetical protein